MIYCAKAQDDFSKKQLFDLLKTPIADSTLIDTYNELVWPIYSYEQPDSSVFYAEKAIDLSKKINDQKRLSIAYRRLGITYLNTGEIKKSIANEEESYRISEKIKFKKGMQLALNNIGVAYLNSELLNKALSYFLRSLAIVEETKDYSTATKLYTNCGLIYGRIMEYRQSKVCFRKALGYALKNSDKNLIVSSYTYLSSACRNLREMDSAKFYLDAASKKVNDVDFSETKLTYYLNVGLLYSVSKDHKKALEYFLKCTTFETNPASETTIFINIAEEYKTLQNSEKALEYFQKAFELAKKGKAINTLDYVSYELAKIYKSKNDWNKYSQLIDQHLDFKDSNTKMNAVQQIQKQQLEFDYERKEIADSIKFEQRENLKNAQLAVAKADLSKQKSFAVMLVTLLVAIVFVCFFIFNRFVVIKKQKRIIELQKQIMDVKNQEVLDSINYARRLQRAILPQLSDIKKELNFDLLYLPKDIIGGDFYFFEKHLDHIFIAICDCTGHGIPGAIMSVVCCQALQKSIKEFDLSDPGEILSTSRELIIQSLNASQHNIQDGMDCSLVVINKNTGKTYWAGANNPLWVISENKELVEVKADKQPVAFYANNRDFTTHEVQIEKGTQLYLFTDGYADQFGGLGGKKFKNKALKELLTDLSTLPVDQQIEKLNQHFITWKNNLDQVDDIAIAVIRFA